MYRENAACKECDSLKEKIKQLEGSSEILPYQATHQAQCVKCTAYLYNGLRISRLDDRWCKGKWYSTCPKIEHMHRHCSHCGGSWIESTNQNK